MVTRKRTASPETDSTLHQVARLMAQMPELAPWLRLYQEVLARSADTGWEEAVAVMTLADVRAPEQPLLAGATIPIDRRLATETLRRLLLVGGAARTADMEGLRAASATAELDAIPPLQAAINHDAAALKVMSAALGVAPEAFATVAHLASIPLLWAAGRALGPAVPSTWGRGYCPVCRAWPAVAELRGLDATRYLRCGRCGGGWSVPPLWCPFCGERAHTALRTLHGLESAATQCVAACTTCHGYVKTTTALRAWAAEEVPLADAATIAWLQPAGSSGGSTRHHDPVHPMRGARMARSGCGDTNTAEAAAAVADVESRPARVCAGLLVAMEGSEGRRKGRKRNTAPDAIGLALKRDLLQRVAHDDPDPEAFEGWLLAQCLAAGAASGPTRAMAREVLDEWRVAVASGDFRQWLDDGAPSDDRRPAENRSNHERRG